ncbi:hypothetical protein NDU88_004864 [Pleurodeles waltl]|uniref:Uncharacterized protein n=1 Tax=Pleurodeles waltl TaxID=8319 RepID=A0AAV7MWD2_PLEWA|nr:hypothetical protein NDU88_004864 [Pleurodeles waltl]
MWGEESPRPRLPPAHTPHAYTLYTLESSSALVGKSFSLLHGQMKTQRVHDPFKGGGRCGKGRVLLAGQGPPTVTRGEGGGASDSKRRFTGVTGKVLQPGNRRHVVKGLN